MLTEAPSVAPSFECYPSSSWSLGPDAVELAASAGLHLDPWQVYALDRILAENADGTPAAFEIGLIVPRQNGKGSVLEALCLAWLFLTDTPLILHSAHEFKTAAEAFRRLRMLIKGAPDLDRRVSRVTTAAGNEAIELFSGQRLRYVARSKGSGRGFTGGKLILDEAYAIEAAEMAALVPTLATQAEAQLVYTSSAGMDGSTHLREVRKRGRSGSDPSLCYLEWGGLGTCPDGCVHHIDDPSCALNDRGLWRSANPGYEIRIPESRIEGERRALDARTFGRERMGLWDEETGGSPISVEDWMAGADAGSVASGRPAFGVDASPRLRSGVIVAATWRPDGTPHVEVVEYRQGGAEWLPERLRELRRSHRGVITMPRTSPAAAFLPDLGKLHIPVEMITDAELGLACSALEGEMTVRPTRVRHTGDQIISAALAGASRRDVGDGGWVWQRKSSAADICPVVAMTAALHGLRKFVRPGTDMMQSFG